MMFCIECGTELTEGEHICKGCGKLGAKVRDELLAMSEKSSDLKCPKCGADIFSGQHFCSICGAAVTC
jgi:predicted amidophosphoribosyltransferase